MGKKKDVEESRRSPRWSPKIQKTKLTFLPLCRYICTNFLPEFYTNPTSWGTFIHVPKHVYVSIAVWPHETRKIQSKKKAEKKKES